MEEDKNFRRKHLEHSFSCPMQDSIYQNCNCHLDDCLNYTGEKQKYRCICPQLNAQDKSAREYVKWMKLPLLKRIFIKKPKWTYYYHEFI